MSDWRNFYEDFDGDEFDISPTKGDWVDSVKDTVKFFAKILGIILVIVLFVAIGIFEIWKFVGELHIIETYGYGG